MSEPCVVGVVGYSGAGKTTVVLKLIRHFQSKGKSVAIVKHDGHADTSVLATHETLRETLRNKELPTRSTWQKADSDTDRFERAGALATMVIGGGRVLWSAPHPETVNPPDWALESVREWTPAVDVIVMEGFKHGAFPKIAVAPTVAQLEELLSQLASGMVVAGLVWTGARLDGASDVRGVRVFASDRWEQFVDFLDQQPCLDFGPSS
ncbi:MAG: molybdopterin-guanine dinucleotide biosynthesis protein MobB [Alicyclobacillaceae bacterium]|nr:molybdopterin-guanine dinucleotide biosynthesis protein MobB [Alicyclobacillaceae bacterium]